MQHILFHKRTVLIKKGSFSYNVGYLKASKPRFLHCRSYPISIQGKKTHKISQKPFRTESLLPALKDITDEHSCQETQQFLYKIEHFFGKQ